MTIVCFTNGNTARVEGAVKVEAYQWPGLPSTQIALVDPQGTVLAAFRTSEVVGFVLDRVEREDDVEPEDYEPEPEEPWE